MAEMYALTKNDTYKDVANGAVDWLLRRGRQTGQTSTRLTTQTETMAKEQRFSLDHHVPTGCESSDFVCCASAI